jgi:hypothetical protein
MSALSNKSLGSGARSLWAVMAACSGVAEIALIVVILALMHGPW